MSAVITFDTAGSKEYDARYASKTRLSPRSYRLRIPRLLNNASQPTSRQDGVVSQSANWGRKFQSHWAASFLSVGIMLSAPCLVIFAWIALDKFQGSLLDMALSLLHHDTAEFVLLYGPRLSLPEFAAYVAWFLFQAGLYTCLPGPLGTGQLTPAGHLLQ